MIGMAYLNFAGNVHYREDLNGSQMVRYPAFCNEQIRWQN